jgi:hypothetical protein
MAVELLKDEYKTPLAVVRGVFLCDNVAGTEVSVLSGNITQEAWGGDTTLGDTDAEGGDVWLMY